MNKTTIGLTFLTKNNKKIRKKPRQKFRQNLINKSAVSSPKILTFIQVFLKLQKNVQNLQQKKSEKFDGFDGQAVSIRITNS